MANTTATNEVDRRTFFFASSLAAGTALSAGFHEVALSGEQADEPKPRRILIDSDAKTEIDDQHAIVRGLIAPELRVEGITAAGYHIRGNGAELSYQEELLLLELMGLAGRIPVALGSSLPMKDKSTPRNSDAVDLIIERAMADEKDPLYVLGLGQFTNLASALLIEPRIKERVVFACIDGDYRHGQKPLWGPGLYNWVNDVAAAQAIFESDVEYIHMPATSVSGKMVISKHDLQRELSGKGAVCDYLASLWNIENFAKKSATVLWDLALVHVMIDPLHGISLQAGAPHVNDDGTTVDAPDNPRQIKVYADIDPKRIFESFWAAIAVAKWLRS